MPSASASIWVLPTSQLFTPAARGGGANMMKRIIFYWVMPATFVLR